MVHVDSEDLVLMLSSMPSALTLFFFFSLGFPALRGEEFDGKLPFRAEDCLSIVMSGCGLCMSSYAVGGSFFDAN